MLMRAENLAHQPPRPVAHHRAADFFAGHHSEPCHRVRRQPSPVGDQTTQHCALPLLPRPREIASLFQTLRTREAQPFRRCRGHGAKRLNRRQAFAAHAPAVGQNGLAALGRVPVQETVLSSAPDLRRLVLAFHKLVAISHPTPRASKPRCAGITPFFGAGENISEKARVKRGNVVGNMRLPTCYPFRCYLATIYSHTTRSRTRWLEVVDLARENAPHAPLTSTLRLPAKLLEHQPRHFLRRRDFERQRHQPVNQAGHRRGHKHGADFKRDHLVPE